MEDCPCSIQILSRLSALDKNYFRCDIGVCRCLPARRDAADQLQPSNPCHAGVSAVQYRRSPASRRELLH